MPRPVNLTGKTEISWREAAVAEKALSRAGRKSSSRAYLMGVKTSATPSDNPLEIGSFSLQRLGEGSKCGLGEPLSREKLYPVNWLLDLGFQPGIYSSSSTSGAANEATNVVVAIQKLEAKLCQHLLGSWGFLWTAPQEDALRAGSGKQPRAGPRACSCCIVTAICSSTILVVVYYYYYYYCS